MKISSEKMKKWSRNFAMIILAGILSMAVITDNPAFAAEGGASTYPFGTFGDFSMNYCPPGLYFRENIIYYSGKVDNLPVAPTVFSNMEIEAWVNLLQGQYITEKKILGANYVVGFGVPYGFTQKLKMNNRSAFAAVPGHMEDQTAGLGDIQVSPIGLQWNLGRFHLVISELICLPTGRYNPQSTFNMGRDYYSLDTMAGMTWLHEKNGHEISFLAGYRTNTRNQTTQYKTGDEFHIDYAVNQYFSPKFGVGLVGYYYKQVTDDGGAPLDAINTTNAALGLPTPDGFKSKGAAIGPAIMFSPGKDMQIIAKWYHEYEAENRFKGDEVFLSFCMKF